MFELRQTRDFKEWLDALTDIKTRARIAQRLVRLQSGLFGDVKFFSGVGELRIDTGPGYRVYFLRRGQILIVLLCAGDKQTQKRDIKKAIQLASELEKQNDDGHNAL